MRFFLDEDLALRLPLPHAAEPAIVLRARESPEPGAATVAAGRRMRPAVSRRAAGPDVRSAGASGAAVALACRAGMSALPARRARFRHTRAARAREHTGRLAPDAPVFRDRGAAARGAPAGAPPGLVPQLAARAPACLAGRDPVLPAAFRGAAGHRLSRLFLPPLPRSLSRAANDDSRQRGRVRLCAH